MGGGALSSNVSKLGSKEVSKKLRNFIPRPLKKVYHCEDERSEDVAIAKSLNINEITTSHFANAPRNDKYRHAELVSASQSRRGIKGEGKCAFTLAEVLITLGIIGVVSALTLPSVVAKFQQKSFSTAFKKEYSILNNAINMVVFEQEAKECYQTVIRDDEGNLIYSASNSDCYALKSGLISKLNLTKIKKDFTYPTQNEVLNKGGVTVNRTVAYDGWLQNASQYAYLSPDGAIFIFYYSTTSGSSYREIPFIIDVNGKKGPNRWGYDVFWLSLVKNENGIRLSDEYATLSEKGGSLPRNIILNNWSNDYNKKVHYGVWK